MSISQVHNVMKEKRLALVKCVSGAMTEVRYSIQLEQHSNTW